MYTETHKFVCEELEYDDSLGWRPIAHPTFDPTGGVGVAHDCLEHYEDKEQEVCGELIAVGHMLYTRSHTEARNLGYVAYPFYAEIANMVVYDCLEYLFDERGKYGDTLRKPPPTKPIQDHCYMPNVEEVISQAIHEAQSTVAEDHGGWEARLLQMDAWNSVRGWLRIGFQKATERYIHDPYSVAIMFNQIEMLVEEYLAAAAEGDVMTICLNPKRLLFHIEVEEIVVWV